MSRPSKEVVQKRVEQILRIVLDGAEGWDLCEYVREQEHTEGSIWHVAEGFSPLSYSQIRRYAARAEKLIGESCRASRKRLLRRHLAQRRNLYAKSVNQGDIRTALSVLRDEAELLGLYDFRLAQLEERIGRLERGKGRNGDQAKAPAAGTADRGATGTEPA